VSVHSVIETEESNKNSLNSWLLLTTKHASVFVSVCLRYSHRLVVWKEQQQCTKKELQSAILFLFFVLYFQRAQHTPIQTHWLSAERFKTETEKLQ